MRRGEKALIECTSTTLFSDFPKCLEPPQGENLSERWVLDVELQEFIETSDISFEQDGSVTKQSLRCRNAWPKCNFGGRCTLLVSSLRNYHGEILAKKDRLLEFVIGNGEVCDAIECAAASMQEGEVAEVNCSSVGSSDFCNEPLIGISEQRNLTFRVEVVKYQVGPWEEALGDAAKLKVLQLRKDKGVDVFKSKRYFLAAYHFRQVYELLGYVDDFRGVHGSEAHKAQIAELKKLSMLNRALSLLKVGSYKLVLQACGYVLEEDSQNLKALFRRAQAHLELEDYFDALRDLKSVLEVDPSNADAKRLMAEVKRRQKEADSTSKEMFARMCAGLGELPHPLDVD
eukprot:TRINITY_DN5084_c0_g1_i1.p1 TRINITY_DN5084_c0_g1~~TRINITY_DN5084_c0_g1_i1.p1  ORF type:complete len:344 (-),score=78.74 TRINITY_DN5084_c0_g1_i1:354-1385(-)